MNLEKLPEKPNMVLIITDQEREVMHWPDGWAEENLPARSRLMAHGLAFRNAHCNTAACSPSRASLFTGLYPAQHGVKNLIFCDDPKDEAKRRTPQLPSSLPNIATVMAEAGYHVVLKGKFHLSRPAEYNHEMERQYWSDADAQHMADRYGFQGWNPPDMSDPMGLSDFGGGDINNDGRYVDGSGTAAGHYMPADEQYRQSAVNFINTYDGDKPFCLIVSLVNPHDVQAYPGRGLQGIMEMKIKPIYEQGGYDLDDFKDLPIDVPPTVDEDLSSKPTVHRSFRQLIGVGTGHVRTRTRQQNYARFYAYLCREVDHQIGKVLDALDSNDLTKQTLIIRTSDHGEMAMSHGRLRQKFYNIYRETLNVPLIFSNPKLFPTPQTTDAFAGLVDILPTLATIADVPDRERYQFRGQDLTPILVDSTASVQDTIHFTYEDDVFPVKGANCIRALVEKDWKYAVYYDPFKGAPTEYEMYDLKNDPLETTNLAHPTHFRPEYAAERTRLHNRLIEVMEELGTLPDETKWPTADQFEPARKGGAASAKTTLATETMTKRGTRQYEAQIDIDAPIETVWQVFTDFASFGQWNPLLTSVEIVNQGEIGVGSELNVSVSALPAPVRATVIEYDPPFTLRWRDHVPLNLLTPRFGVTLEPLEGERTRFTIAESFDGPLVHLLGPMLDRQMPPNYAAMCEALKQRVTPSANSNKNPLPIEKGNSSTMNNSLILAALALPPLIYAGAPKLLTFLGLHPHYHGRKFNLADKKALVICTSHDTLGDTGKATGVYGSEMTVPYYQFLDASMQVDIASPKGGEVPIEPASLKWPMATAADKRFKGDADFQRKVKHSLKFDEVNFTEYDMIFMAGGWGAAFDLGYSEVLGQKASQAYRNGAILGSVCHGALGLLNVMDENGKPLLKGLNATAVTDKQVQELGINITPQHPETELRKAGAKFQSNTAFRDIFADLTVVDGRVVTGQNQNAGAETAQKMMMLLEKQARN